MQSQTFVRCPLCRNVVRPGPAAKASDRPDLGRHIARECTVRIA